MAGLDLAEEAAAIHTLHRSHTEGYRAHELIEYVQESKALSKQAVDQAVVLIFSGDRQMVASCC